MFSYDTPGRHLVPNLCRASQSSLHTCLAMHWLSLMRGHGLILGPRSAWPMDLGPMETMCPTGPLWNPFLDVDAILWAPAGFRFKCVVFHVGLVWAHSGRWGRGPGSSLSAFWRGGTGIGHASLLCFGESVLGDLEWFKRPERPSAGHLEAAAPHSNPTMPSDQDVFSTK